MYRIVLLLLVFCTLSPAEERPRHTLTKTQITEGWLQLFDGQTTFGWKVDEGAKVDEGRLLLPAQAKARYVVPFASYELNVIHGKKGLSQIQLKKTAGSEKLKTYMEPDDKQEVMLNTSSDEMILFGTGPLLIHAVFIRPLEMKPIFNGKDLTGWKTNRDKAASKFTVTPEGWLNVQDGPGDLQTEARYSDFVLQLECISNGKHLNSGIFFRCIPDLYQQGYEAQIRNQWEGDNRDKPVDFGTGAIYRRVAARRVVSSDHEWFTMTVAARGKQISTWVNGYPVVNWIDDRKEADNARQGAKTSAGAISIQGHDPTTNLSFRNLRIQESARK